MTNRMKNITKLIAFGVIILVLLFVFSMMMTPQKWFDDKLIQNRDSRYIQVTEQAADSIDVLNIGDSLSLSILSPMELWREQGITGFNIGADGLRMAESYYYLKNACRNQKPKVLMMESLYLFRYNLSDDSIMLLSQPIYYNIPFLKFHNIWKAAVELPGVMIYHKGYTINENVAFYEGDPNYLELPLADKKQRLEIPEYNRIWFDRIKKYCDEQGIRILLYSAPSAVNYNWERINNIKAFAQKEGLDYIDFNEIADEVGINWRMDSNDGGDHMNYFGCCKCTSYFGNYLRDNMGLIDHRGDSAYSSWDEELVSYDQLVIDMDGLSFQDIHRLRERAIKRAREQKRNKTRS